MFASISQRNKVRKHNRTPHKRFSKMISLNAKKLETVLVAEHHVAVMFSCRTFTCSAKVSCRTLQIAEPKALNLEKDYLAEAWNARSFRNSQSPFSEPLLRAPSQNPFSEPFYTVKPIAGSLLRTQPPRTLPPNPCRTTH